MNLRESAGKAMFAVDWPKDSWERLGDGYHQDRYRKMADAAILAMFNHLADNVSEGMIHKGMAAILQGSDVEEMFVAVIKQARKEYEEAKG